MMQLLFAIGFIALAIVGLYILMLVIFSPRS